MTRLRLASWWLVLPLVSVACSSQTPSFPVMIRTLTDDGKPLPGVELKLAQTVGKTDADGRWIVRVNGQEGTEIPVDVTAPKGYRLATVRTGIILRKMLGIDGKLVPLEHGLKFTPIERTYAILVRTGMAGLPVETFGHRQAITGDKGSASFLYTGVPGDELAVRVLTGDHPELRPISPTQSIILGQQSDAYVVQAKFAMPKPIASSKPKVHKPVHLGPKRL